MNHNFSFSRIVQLQNRFKGSVLSGAGAQSLSGRASRSGVWIGGGFVIQRGLQFASNLILTRLLFPEAFGLMALCSVFLVGLGMFSDLGLKPAIIRDPRGNDRDFLNTAWTIQVIRGFVLFVGGCLLAYPVSILYDQPVLLPLLAILSTTAAITGFSSVKMITAERDLNFRTITLIQIAGQVIHILTMVILAFYWRSVWSLAVGGVVGSLTTMVLSHALLFGHRHRFYIDPDSAKSLIHFGKWIFFSTIVTFLGGEGLRAIQAGLITTAEFGILTIAYSIAAIPIELASRLTSAIGLPALSEAYRNNADALSVILRKFRLRVLILSAVMLTAVTLFSEPIILMLYDNRYHAAGLLVAVITISSSINLVTNGYSSALLTVGKSDTLMWTMVFAAIARICSTIAGLKLFGIVGMIIGVGVANLATLAIFWPIMYKLKVRHITLDLVFLFFLLILSQIVIFW